MQIDKTKIQKLNEPGLAAHTRKLDFLKPELAGVNSLIEKPTELGG